MNLPSRVIVSSDIPIGSGLGSSGALLVAFVKLLSHMLPKNLSTLEIAKYVYIAEREILGIPCGRLDQYSSAIGGVIYLKTKPPVQYEALGFPSKFKLAVVDSGIKYRTKDIHSERQSELELAINEILKQDVPQRLREKLNRRLDEIPWNSIKEMELKWYLDCIPTNLANRILFTINMNKLTSIAVRILKGEQLGCEDKTFLRRISVNASNKLDLLCGIVNKQHELLRDLYEVSLPKIAHIRDTISNETYARK